MRSRRFDSESDPDPSLGAEANHLGRRAASGELARVPGVSGAPPASAGFAPIRWAIGQVGKVGDQVIDLEVGPDGRRPRIEAVSVGTHHAYRIDTVSDRQIDSYDPRYCLPGDDIDKAIEIYLLSQRSGGQFSNDPAKPYGGGARPNSFEYWVDQFFWEIKADGAKRMVLQLLRDDQGRIRPGDEIPNEEKTEIFRIMRLEGYVAMEETSGDRLLDDVVFEGGVDKATREKLGEIYRQRCELRRERGRLETNARQSRTTYEANQKLLGKDKLKTPDSLERDRQKWEVAEQALAALDGKIRELEQKACEIDPARKARPVPVGFHGTNRSEDTVRKLHKGTTRFSDLPNVEEERGIDRCWHPLHHKQGYQGEALFRLRNGDNELITTVSVARSHEEASEFNLINTMLDDPWMSQDVRYENGMYVTENRVFIVGVERGYDTDAMQREHQTGEFGKGEIATRKIELERHYGVIHCKRYHDGPTREHGMHSEVLGRTNLVDLNTHPELYEQIDAILQKIGKPGTRAPAPGTQPEPPSGLSLARRQDRGRRRIRDMEDHERDEISRHLEGRRNHDEGMKQRDLLTRELAALVARKDSLIRKRQENQHAIARLEAQIRKATWRKDREEKLRAELESELGEQLTWKRKAIDLDEPLPEVVDATMETTRRRAQTHDELRSLGDLDKAREHARIKELQNEDPINTTKLMGYVAELGNENKEGATEITVLLGRISALKAKIERLDEAIGTSDDTTELEAKQERWKDKRARRAQEFAAHDEKRITLLATAADDLMGKMADSLTLEQGELYQFVCGIPLRLKQDPTAKSANELLLVLNAARDALIAANSWADELVELARLSVELIERIIARTSGLDPLEEPTTRFDPPPVDRPQPTPRRVVKVGPSPIKWPALPPPGRPPNMGGEAVEVGNHVDRKLEILLADEQLTEAVQLVEHNPGKPLQRTLQRLVVALVHENRLEEAWRVVNMIEMNKDPGALAMGLATFVDAPSFESWVGKPPPPTVTWPPPPPRGPGGILLKPLTQPPTVGLTVYFDPGTGFVACAVLAVDQVVSGALSHFGGVDPGLGATDVATRGQFVYIRDDRYYWLASISDLRIAPASS